jgi:hypothetical protein
MTHLIFWLLCSTLVFAVCQNDVNMGGYKVRNLGQPVDNNDAANKSYVDSLVSFEEGDEPFSVVYTKGNVGIGVSAPKTTLHVGGNAAIVVPVGTTDERPIEAVAGMIRMNSDTGKMEGYTGTEWVSFEK